MTNIRQDSGTRSELPHKFDAANLVEEIETAAMGREFAVPERATLRRDFAENAPLSFVATHVVLDFWGCPRLDDLTVVQRMLRQAAKAAGAALLEITTQRFTPIGGITGVAVFAGSHIAVHTWPERSYAAVDVFMCGAADPHKAVAVIRQALSPETATQLQCKRGVSA